MKQPTSASAAQLSRPRRRCYPAAVPISAVVFFLSLVVSVATVVVVFVVSMSLVQQRFVDTFVNRLADEAVLRCAVAVQRHYDAIARLSFRFGVLANEFPFMVGDVFPDPTVLVQHLGMESAVLGAHVLIANTTDHGLFMGPYSVNPEALGKYSEQLPGRVVVLATAPPTPENPAHNFSSLISYVPYIILPRTTLLGNASLYNFTYDRLFRAPSFTSQRPYTALFSKKFQWSMPYISTLKRASSLAIGGPILSRHPANASLLYQGTYSIHGYSIALAARLAQLNLSSAARVVLFHGATGAFLGGNTADNTTIATNVTGGFRLVMLQDIRDVTISPVLCAGGRDLVECTGSSVAVAGTMMPLCTSVFDPVAGGFAHQEVLWTVTALFREYQLVRVARVTDRYGLDLRLVMVVPLSDFTSELRRSVLTGLWISGTAIALCLVCLMVGAHRVGRPLRTAGRLVASFGRQRSDALLAEASAAVPAPTSHRYLWQRLLHSCRSLQLEEIERVSTMLMKLRQEVAVIQSFLPPAARAVPRAATTTAWSSETSRQDDTSTSRSAGSSTHKATVLSLNAGATSATGLTDLHTSAISNSRLHVEKPPTADAFSVRVVTYAVADVVGFHPCGKNHKDAESRGTGDCLLPTTQIDAHSACLSLVLLAADACGGVVSGFYGDKFHVHFNAEKPLRGHAAAAVRFALMVDEWCHAKVKSPQPPLAPVSDACAAIKVGVATTKAMCGVLCTVSQSSYHILGDCVDTAWRLAYFAKDFEDVTTLMSPVTVRLVRSSSTAALFFRHVTIEVLPHQVVPSVVSEPVLWSTLEARGIRMPRAAGGGRVDDVRAIREAYLISNAAYEDAVETNSLHCARRLMSSSPFCPEDNWLLRTLLEEDSQGHHTRRPQP